MSKERDKALGELRKARDLALEATPLALAGSRRDNANLRRALQQARAEVQSLRRRPPQGISDASRQAADALRRELGGSAPDAKRVDALKERIARLEAERDALRKQLARAPKASVELNALRAEVQAARDEALRARTDLAAGGDLSGRLAAAEDRAATLTSHSCGSASGSWRRRGVLFVSYVCVNRVRRGSRGAIDGGFCEVEVIC